MKGREALWVSFSKSNGGGESRNLQGKHTSPVTWMPEGPRGHFQKYCLGFSCGEGAHFPFQEGAGNWGCWWWQPRWLWGCVAHPGSKRRPGLQGHWCTGPTLLLVVSGSPWPWPRLRAQLGCSVQQP